MSRVKCRAARTCCGGAVVVNGYTRAMTAKAGVDTVKTRTSGWEEKAGTKAEAACRVCAAGEVAVRVAFNPRSVDSSRASRVLATAQSPPGTCRARAVGRGLHTQDVVSESRVAIKQCTITGSSEGCY